MAKAKSTSTNPVATTDQQRDEIRDKIEDIGLHLHCAADICDRLEIGAEKDSDIIHGIKSLFVHAEEQVAKLEEMMLTACVIRERS